MLIFAIFRYLQVKSYRYSKLHSPITDTDDDDLLIMPAFRYTHRPINTTAAQ